MSNDELKRTSPRDDERVLPVPRVVHPTRARKGLQAHRKTTIFGSMVLGVAGAALLGPLPSLAASQTRTSTTSAASAGITAEATGNDEADRGRGQPG